MPNPGSLALFDFDHTVTIADSYARFLRRVATPQQLARAKWSVGPWLASYRLGLVSAQAIRRRVTRVVFAGRAADEIAAQADAYARQVLPTLLRPEMMQRIAWHRTQGHRIALVSASLDLYLQPWCAEHGLDLICNRLEARDGRLTGRYADGDCGPHKARLIRARYDVGAYPRVYAYGDSREDRPMLALAHERWYGGHRVA
ncbi:HAD family hydrolase [Xanthomonas sp. NCPPB 2654]|uniref:HAD family hydrolase n=1 Tax=unclassified Xanthomonas TaxID=2643310 RepID=UPI0021E0DEE9|nr:MULTISPECIES: HAD family hydrolase [unclassified Xanthomonas]MDL5364509.1 HAD family hydrolase [Xanthomonas sp. NCPPB 2654]UYC22172.1 HAD-IB family hydrolase [Xanthomonas sp. CFBP 8443]